MRIFFFLASVLLQLNAAAQLSGQSFIDSLIKQIPHTKNDTAKAKLYKLIVEQYIDSKPDEAMLYAEAGAKHVSAMKWNKGIAVFNNIIGSLFNDKGEYNKAFDKFNKAYTIHLADKDSFNAASTLNNIGTGYFRQSAYDKASEHYFAALKLAEGIRNNNLTAICLGNIASVYYQQSNFSKALEYHFRALKIHKVDKYDDGIAESYTNIGDVYQNQKDTGKAQNYYQQALLLYKETENTYGIATVYTNLSLIAPDVKQRLEYQLKAQAIWDEISPGFKTSVMNMGNIVFSYLDISRNDSLRRLYASAIIPASRNEALQKATIYLNKAMALSIESKDIGHYAFLTGAQSELEAEKGDFKKAYYDAKTYHRLHDSIYSQENKNKIATIEGQREVVIRDNEIAFNKAALANQRKLKWALIAGIGLLLSIAGLLYYQNRTRKRTNTTLMVLNNQLDEANKVKAKFFAILSHDLRSPVANLINFLHLQKEEPGFFTAQQAEAHQQRITNSANGLLETMEAMLQWSKAQMENFKPEIKSVPVSNLFEYLEKFFADTENIAIRFGNVDGLIVNTDENYLRTIMHNLTANAVKALKNKPVAAISWQAREENNKTILSITDNGPGISEEQAKALNEGITVGSSKYGLGFHLIRDLAKAIFTTVSFQSKPGAGTTFTLSIQ